MQLYDNNYLFFTVKSTLHLFGKEEEEVDMHEMVLIVKLYLYIVIFF